MESAAPVGDEAWEAEDMVFMSCWRLFAGAIILSGDVAGR